jgi:hypothetical protein
VISTSEREIEVVVIVRVDAGKVIVVKLPEIEVVSVMGGRVVVDTRVKVVAF